MNNSRESQEFKKGCLYTRSDIYNLYFGEPLPLKGTANWKTGYVQPQNSKDLIVFMNIDVPGKSGHNYPNKYNPDNKTIEWFGKTNSNSQQPTFLKLKSKEIVPHFFARWDNKQREFLYLGIGKNFQFEDNYPTKTSEGKDAKCLKVTLNCDDSDNILMSDDKAVNDSFNFKLEKHLEEFIIANWNQTFLCKEYDIYKDEENSGQQFPTDTGPIDILAISKDKKTFLVIELKKNRLHDKVVGQIQRYMGFIKGEIANDDQKVKGLIIGLKESLGLQRAISINPDIEYRIYKISFELLKK
tara:strand:+ start:345 stop:1241 length:897 start_codon:yes stop_codon:yes gene_type:complete